MKGRNVIIICIALAAIVFLVGYLLGTSGSKDAAITEETVVEQPQKRLSSADAMEAIRHESKLYSSEQTAHKKVVISTKDVMSVLGYKFTKPWSHSNYVIPIDVTYKACIDLGRISQEIELTSCEVIHKDEIVDQQVFASTQSQDFFNKAVSDAEQGIWAEISMQRKQELLTDAKRNAEGILADALLKSGFRRVNITYSSSLNPDRLTVERNHE